MYQKRMIGYYPKVIQSILEYKAIVNAEYPEIEEVSGGRERIISDAYLLTMSEERVAQWERILGITSVTGSSLDDRRETVIARIRGQGKLNTSLIQAIVKTFTGSGCNTWIENSVLNVSLLPPKDGKEYVLDNIIQELTTKVPAHLGLMVSKAWKYWNDVNDTYGSWSMVRNYHGTWEDVLYGQTKKPNELDTSELDSFYLG